MKAFVIGIVCLVISQYVYAEKAAAPKAQQQMMQMHQPLMNGHPQMFGRHAPLQKRSEQSVPEAAAVNNQHPQAQAQAHPERQEGARVAESHAQEDNAGSAQGDVNYNNPMQGMFNPMMYNQFAGAGQAGFGGQGAYGGQAGFGPGFPFQQPYMPYSHL